MDIHLPIETTALYIALNAIIALALAINVSRVRSAEKVDIGDGGNQRMLQAIRAHGNNTEYVPIALLIIGAVEIMGGVAWFVHALGAVLTISRLLHAQGMLSSTGASFGRVSGSVLTQLVYVAGAIALLYYYFA